MSVDPELETFWKEKHDTGDRHYLSGNGEDALDKLRIRGIFCTVAALLNIGVGLGIFEKYARRHVQRLDCVDITLSALAVITGVADHFYPDVAFAPANTYDMVTELLVAQHISDETLLEHLTGGIRSLKPDGIFALQVADFLHPPTPDALAKNYTLESKKAGSVKRTEDTMQSLIKTSGGRVLSILPGEEYSMYESRWMVYHIGKAT